MKCYYLDEHLKCINYDAGENPMLNVLELKAEQKINREILYNKLILVVKGRINYSYAMHENVTVEENNLFFLLSGYKVELNIMADCQLILFHIKTLRQLCDNCQLEQLMDIDCEVDTSKPHILPFNKRVQTYVNGVLAYFGDGLRCYYFHEMKLKELFFIFRMYYPKEDMKRLFYALLTNDISFSELVLKASTEAKNVKDLANVTGYSVSGFGKRFKRVFGIPAYQWLQQKRADRLFNQISKTGIQLKTLIDKEGFANGSELSKFCKRYYGDTPSNLRKSGRIGEKTQ